MDPIEEGPAVVVMNPRPWIVHYANIMHKFADDPVATFARHRHTLPFFFIRIPGWCFAAPGAATHAEAMEANPDFFLRYPNALNPLAGMEDVLLNDAFNPWIDVAPRRNRRTRRDDHPPPEVYPEPTPVEVSQGVPWYPPRIRHRRRRHVRKHYVVRKGGRSNVQKAYQARKGSFTSSPNGCPGHFVYGSYGAGGRLEY